MMMVNPVNIRQEPGSMLAPAGQFCCSIWSLMAHHVVHSLIFKANGLGILLKNKPKHLIMPRLQKPEGAICQYCATLINNLPCPQST
eukprot:1160178-Pelagomonas_calceolata.AAC.4